MRRRDFLGAGLTGLAAFGVGAWHGTALAQETEAAAEGAPGDGFARTQLIERARRLAEEPYEQPGEIPEEKLPEMGYSAYNGIRFNSERAVWADSGLPFRLELFHPGLYFRRPVEIFLVEDGEIRPLSFDPSYFRYEDQELAGRIAGDLPGFAGFRVHHQTDWSRDFLSFLGASYFRAVGETMQYGLSARGIAVNTTNLGKEEFPSFRSFWIERPRPGDSNLTIHALLDGRSLTGLYSFHVHAGTTTEMRVEVSLFARRQLDNFGIAPVTSMYYSGENDWMDRRLFRAEAHDSDGLAMRRGNGEWVWRPLSNPSEPRISTFTDEHPRGFGMLQRDRVFENYNDLGADYEDRPNLWTEPEGDWGKGSVELIELPTEDETFDNMVAYWRPEQPLEPGSERRFAYRLYWGDEMPERLARPAEVVATRIGRAGRPGDRQPGLKFVIDYEGGMLGRLGKQTTLDAKITASRGEAKLIEVVPIEETGGWRIEFDLDVGGDETVDLRAFLLLGEQALSETWLYRLEPSEWAPILRG